MRKETADSFDEQTAISGRLSLELSQIRFSRIIFQYSHRPQPSAAGAKQPVVHFPPDHQALDVFAELPKAIHLDRPRMAVLCVASGRNEVGRVVLRVQVGLEVGVGLEEARVVGGSKSGFPTSC